MLVQCVSGYKLGHHLAKCAMRIAIITPGGPGVVSCAWQKDPLVLPLLYDIYLFVVLPTIVWWGAVGSMLGIRFDLNSPYILGLESCYLNPPTQNKHQPLPLPVCC